ncbi:hypothetical protein [Nonomuraea sp. NPDC048901]|uniref:tetratricopeptide repeat protein n=1 Tax=Nonomuraea sp. NPDC048901 TaxID=3155627 RepID=UPI0033DC3532
MGTSGMDAAPGPYRGLRVFRGEDRHGFFGRDAESRVICQLWQSKRLTVLYGASGSGKTSLIQAGVIPLLSPNRTDVLPLGRVSYGSCFPQAALPAHDPYVLALLMSWSPMATPTRLASMTIPAFLRARPVKRDTYGDPTLTMVAIDQVEELFATGRRRHPYRDWFFGQLGEALHADPGLRLLLSIRADRLRDLLPYERELAGSDRERFPLEALDQAGALEAVTRPIEGTGHVFAPGVAEQIVRDLIQIRGRSNPAQQAEGVDPVHLQVVCEALWNALPAEATKITATEASLYADKTLSEHYHRVIGEIAAERLNGDEHRLRTWLRLAFADRSGSRQPVRQSAIRLAGISRATVALLVTRHLLRADQHMGESSYELAYDRLLQAPAQEDYRPRAYPDRLPTEDHLRAAESALREGDLVLAEQHGKEGLARSEQDDHRVRAQIESLLGNIALKRGELSDAVSRYSAAAKSFETAGEVAAVGPMLTAIGRLRLTQGSPNEAVRHLRAAMVRVPADLTIQTELAWALWHGGHPDAAVGVLNDVLDREGNNADALLGRGQMLAGMGRARAALRDLDRARPLRWPFAKIAHALALAQTDSLEEAQQEMMEALAEAVDDGPLLLYAARVEELAGKTTSAVDLAKAAISAQRPALPEHMKQDAHRLVGAR